MSALLWRILFAVFCVVIIFLLIPPLFRILGFDVSGDVATIIKVCIAGLAILYIWRGSSPVPPA